MEIFVSYLFFLVNVDTFLAGLSITREAVDHLTHTSPRIGCMLCADTQKAYILYATQLLSVWFLPVSIVPCFILPHIGEFVVRVARRHFLMKHRALVYKQQYRRAKVLHFRTMQTLLPKLGEDERFALYKVFQDDYKTELGDITIYEFLKIDYNVPIAVEYHDVKAHSSDLPYTTDPVSDDQMPEDSGASWCGRNPFTPFQLVMRLAGFFFPRPSTVPGIPDCYASYEMQTIPRVFTQPIYNEFTEFTVKKAGANGGTIILPVLVSRGGQVALILIGHQAGDYFNRRFLGVFGGTNSYSVPKNGRVNAHHGNLLFFQCTGKSESDRRLEYDIFDKVRRGLWTQPVHVHLFAIGLIDRLMARKAALANTPRLIEYDWINDKSGEDPTIAPPEPSKPKTESKSWFSMFRKSQPPPTEPEVVQTPVKQKYLSYTILYGMIIPEGINDWETEYSNFLYETAADGNLPKKNVDNHLVLNIPLEGSAFKKRTAATDVSNAHEWARKQSGFTGFPFVVLRPDNTTPSEPYPTPTATEQPTPKPTPATRDVKQELKDLIETTATEMVKPTPKPQPPPPTADAVAQHIKSGQPPTPSATHASATPQPIGFERKEKQKNQHPERPLGPKLIEPDHDYMVMATAEQVKGWRSDNIKAEKDWMLTHPEYQPKYAQRSKEESC